MADNGTYWQIMALIGNSSRYFYHRENEDKSCPAWFLQSQSQAMEFKSLQPWETADAVLFLLFGTRLHHLQKLLADVNFSVNPLPSSPIRIVCAPRLMPGIYYSTSRRNQTEYWTRKSIANYGLLTCLCKGNYFPSESVAQGWKCYIVTVKIADGTMKTVKVTK